MKPLIAVLALALAACGGGGDTPPEAPVAPADTTYHPPLSPTLKATPVAQRVIRISMYGDSTVYGTSFVDGTYVKSAHNEPVSVQWQFDQDFGPGKVIVTNRGIPGSTCPELLWGQAPVKTPWAQEIANNPDDLILVNEGINDAFRPWEADTDFAFCYQQLGSTVKLAGKGFIIEGPNPIDKQQNDRLQQLVAIEQQVALGLGVPSIPTWQAITSQYPDWQSQLPDQIHPSDGLYEYKAYVAYQTLKPIVKWMLAQ